ncbi:MAG: hypothetical protein IPI49_21510 [Myxococcales bacterium]|nr:hypothetical protein [Myxococcales bacterium]HRC56723.1 hypothetical protein [Kofleriaceae bacterium]
MLSRLLLLALVLPAAASCTRKPKDVPCAAVAGRLLVLAQDQTRAAKIDEALRQRVTMQLPALRDAVEESCTRGKWSAAVRSCMMQAADGAAMAACQLQLTDDQRAALRRASGSTATP